jgi:hypothetical protein
MLRVKSNLRLASPFGHSSLSSKSLLHFPAIHALVYRTLEAVALPSYANKASCWLFGWPAMLALPAALRD